MAELYLKKTLISNGTGARVSLIFSGISPARIIPSTGNKIMSMNLLDSLIHTANCSGVIPTDVFMSGFRTDNADIGWNDFTFWGESHSPDNDENLALDNSCPDRS
jgi:hypothetical protein